jgi:hypothetical protein
VWRYYPIYDSGVLYEEYQYPYIYTYVFDKMPIHFWLLGVRGITGLNIYVPGLADRVRGVQTLLQLAAATGRQLVVDGSLFTKSPLPREPSLDQLYPKVW